MIPTRSFVRFALLLTIIIIHVQSVPVKVPSKNLIDDVKKKRNIEETLAQLPADIDQLGDTDITMNPNELSNLARKRRHIHLQQRRKRSLSSYDYYNNNPFYQSLVRPTRSFAPIRWYPPSEWNGAYSNTIENEDIDEDQIPFYLNDDDEDENGYEYNRYPVLLDLSDVPYDNLQLQQEYNTDDLPIDDDDDDEELFSSLYDPLEEYFK